MSVLHTPHKAQESSHARRSSQPSATFLGRNGLGHLFWHTEVPPCFVCPTRQFRSPVGEQALACQANFSAFYHVSTRGSAAAARFATLASLARIGYLQYLIG